MRSSWLFVTGACFAIALPIPAATDVIYDSEGFEKFIEGMIDENGQNGWLGGAFEGGVYPWVVTGDPSRGTKSIRLALNSFEGSSSVLNRDFGDLIAAGYARVTVSFDVYRSSAHSQWLPDLWWAWGDQGAPTWGIQLNGEGPDTLRTYPLLDGYYPTDLDLWAQTPLDVWATVELTWDFGTGIATGRYGGVLVSQKKIDGIHSLTDWTFYLTYDGADDGYLQYAWIDNFIITGEKAGCYPDFNGDGALDLFDFLAYVNAFNAQGPTADCDASGSLDLFDFLCFVNAFNQGC